MKRILSAFLVLILALSLSGCTLLEFFHDGDSLVDLGNGTTAVRWNLVSDPNEYSAVESAYFEFDQTSFRYYENGALKKEGTHRITYSGVENTISPLHINLIFEDDNEGNSVFDYLDCYTEDAKDGLSQFTIIREAYKIKPLRGGGVPVRDYHLSEMPYAFGTYVREGAEERTYTNGKANYLNCAKLDGTFVDDKGNSFYFLNNSYSSDPDSVHYTIYMRYENQETGTSVEGTIRMSYYEEFATGKKHNVALIYVTHGEGEPAAESGKSVDADFELMDFDFGEDSFSIASGKLFAESTESEFDPAHFAGGVYRKVQNG